jgi:hypothetical protein
MTWHWTLHAKLRSDVAKLQHDVRRLEEQRRRNAAFLAEGSAACGQVEVGRGYGREKDRERS